MSTEVLPSAVDRVEGMAGLLTNYTVGMVGIRSGGSQVSDSDSEF